MAVGLHPKYRHRDLNIKSSPYHVNIEFDGLYLLGIYIPSSEANMLAFFKSHFNKYIKSNTIVVGNFNMPLNKPQTFEDHQLLDFLLDKRLFYQDLDNTQYTFHRQMHGKDQDSFVDHLLVPLNNNTIH